MKLLYNITLSTLLPLALLCCSCGGSKGHGATGEADASATAVPEFSADSAFASIETQCAFGPRTLDSEAHDKCADYICRAFESMGCRVSRQSTEFTRYDGVRLPGCNIIAESRPEARFRIMLCTHWDSRPWCDHDADEANWHRPVTAANDGASGVGVMLEVARALQAQPISVGVDFVCFDAEDMGTPEWDDDGLSHSDTWCLGSAYWARHPHSTDIKAAILLDMVGGIGARFHQEQFSLHYAQSLTDRIWAAAAEAGYADFFPKSEGGAITDDHLPINRIARIPAIDIVPYYVGYDNAFGPTWHTAQDTPQNISLATLKAVGQTLLHYLYSDYQP